MFQAMTRLALAAAVLWNSAAGMAAAAQSDALAGVLQQVSRDVSRQTGGRGAWQPLQVKDVLRAGDQLRTGTESVAEMRFQDGALSRLGPSSALTLAGDRPRVLKLWRGKLWLRLPRGGALTEIRTPAAVANVVGTDVLVTVDDAQRATFVVLDQEPGHQLLVQALDPGTGQSVGQAITLNSSQQTTVIPGQPAAAAQEVVSPQVLLGEESGGSDRPWMAGTAASPGADPAPGGVTDQGMGQEQYSVVESVQPAEVNTDGTWRPAVTGETLTAGDRIRTGPDGKLSLAVTTRVSLEIQPVTEMVLGSRGGQPLLELLSGEAKLVVIGDDPIGVVIATPYYLATGLNPGTTTITDNSFEFQGVAGTLPGEQPSFVIYKNGVVSVPSGDKFVALEKPAIPPLMLLPENEMLLTNDSGAVLTVIPGVTYLPEIGGGLRVGVLPEPTAGVTPVAPAPAPAPGIIPAPVPAAVMPPLEPPLPGVQPVTPGDLGGTSPTTGGLNTEVK